jgi:hypothetical protein
LGETTRLDWWPKDTTSGTELGGLSTDGGGSSLTIEELRDLVQHGVGLACVSRRESCFEVTATLCAEIWPYCGAAEGDQAFLPTKGARARFRLEHA